MTTNTTTADTKIENLFKAGAHFGYLKSRRHPSSKPYLFGTKNKMDIFDLEKTVESLDAAKEFVKNIAKGGGTIIFVASKHEARDAMKLGAVSADQPYVSGRWVGGTISNFTEIKKRVARMLDLIDKREKGELAKYTKKERLLLDREIDKLETLFGGIRKLKELPKAIFVIDPKKESIAVREANGVNIPVIALAGSDCNLGDVEYPIPGNDASMSSVKFFVNEIVEAYKEGQLSKKEEIK